MIKSTLKLMLGLALLAGLTACPSSETTTTDPASAPAAADASATPSPAGH